MMECDEDFCRLMGRVGEGSEDAAWELVARYGEQIHRTVRRVLNIKLRSKFDSLDFVQLVWKSFFQVRNKCDRFHRPEELAAFLVTMATRESVVAPGPRSVAPTRRAASATLPAQALHPATRSATIWTTTATGSLTRTSGRTTRPTTRVGSRAG